MDAYRHTYSDNHIKIYSYTSGRKVATSCEHSNEVLSSTKCSHRNFLHFEQQ